MNDIENLADKINDIIQESILVIKKRLKGYSEEMQVAGGIFYFDKKKLEGIQLEATVYNIKESTYQRIGEGVNITASFIRKKVDNIPEQIMVEFFRTNGDYLDKKYFLVDRNQPISAIIEPINIYINNLTEKFITIFESDYLLN